ncbi:DUF938 domain-containing protein [Undibacterium fentianense]|uniref:DUF938 domain-containing protein n=1 Tax=Undibacterium fentianense TaxID=2828728 RepID=A0A941IC40_9BURK|nr:DUF938 domain-containing protein [Undibacterium fentianense]MBR7799789.1 DUF938 domain-containing protein [Undibacterium fentianense]
MNIDVKQYSPACERNQDPILAQLKHYLNSAMHVLEIGSGTGQHAVYFSQHLPHLMWHPSDRCENHPSIRAWIASSTNNNIAQPIALDVAHDPWPTFKFDAIFTANTCHIMRWEEVCIMLKKAASVLKTKGHMLIYGPFNYDGQFTSPSNKDFDAALRLQAPHRGIRDIQDIVQITNTFGFDLLNDIAMPANNRLLVFSLLENTNDSNHSPRNDE